MGFGSSFGGVLGLGLVGIIVYFIYQFQKNTPKTGPLGLSWPKPGQEGTNIGGQTVGTSELGTQYNIHDSLWTVFPADGSNPIVDINANSDPVGPSGQSIAQLQAALWTNQQIADMIGMGGIAAPANLGPGAPVGGVSGTY